MLRRVFSIVSVISLLLIAGTGVLWILTYQRAVLCWAEHRFPNDHGFVSVGCGGEVKCGGFSVTLTRYHAIISGPSNSVPADYSPPYGMEAIPLTLCSQPTYYLEPTRPTLLGFQFRAERSNSAGINIRQFAMAFPFWFPAAMFCVPPLAWLLRRYRRKRRAALAGLFCRSCGFDLRANIDCCPECGTPITSNEGTAA